MDMILNIIAGMLGILFQMFARMDSLRKYFKAANQEFVMKKFFRDDWMSIAGSITFVFIMAITVKELIVLRPGIEQYQRITFTMGGAIGSWAFGYFLGKSKKYIQQKIDDKTKPAVDKDEKPIE